MIPLIILGYVACAVAAGYCCGLIGEKDGGAAVIAGLFGPLGLMVMLAVLASIAGARQFQLADRRHALALAELDAQEREMDKLLGGRP